MASHYTNMRAFFKTCFNLEVLPVQRIHYLAIGGKVYSGSNQVILL